MNRRSKIEPKGKNYCCAFILPMCGINHKNLPTNFINAYINKDYQAFMVFDKTVDYDIIFYKFLENTREKNNNLIEVADEDDEIVLKFNISKEYHKDYDTFVEGKYSKFSESYKKTLISYFGQKSRDQDYKANIYNAIHPQDFKRRQIAERIYDSRDINEGIKLIDEVLEAPNLNEEIYKPIQEIIQINNTLTINN